MEIVGLDSPTTILQSYTQTIQDSHLTEIQEKTFIKLRETGQCLYFEKVLQDYTQDRNSLYRAETTNTFYDLINCLSEGVVKHFVSKTELYIFFNSQRLQYFLMLV